MWAVTTATFFTLVFVYHHIAGTLETFLQILENTDLCFTMVIYENIFKTIFLNFLK